jgi:hypothetical protein
MFGVDLNGSGKGPVAGCSKDDNGHSDSMKCWTFLKAEVISTKTNSMELSTTREPTNYCN